MPHTVTMLPSQTAFPVGENEAVLDAALRAGLAVPYSCRQGTCRTCLSHVSAGNCRHDADPDELFIDEDEVEDGWRLLCVTVADSDLSLDGGAILHALG